MHVSISARRESCENARLLVSLRGSTDTEPEPTHARMVGPRRETI
jgi:hypothetical protein